MEITREQTWENVERLLNISFVPKFPVIILTCDGQSPRFNDLELQIQELTSR